MKKQNLKKIRSVVQKLFEKPEISYKPVLYGTFKAVIDNFLSSPFSALKPL